MHDFCYTPVCNNIIKHLSRIKTLTTTSSHFHLSSPYVKVQTATGAHVSSLPSHPFLPLISFTQAPTTPPQAMLPTSVDEAWLNMQPIKPPPL